MKKYRCFVSIDYLQGLPLDELVVKDALSGMLMWVDSSNHEYDTK